MDEFAFESHQKAIAAIDAGKFKAEIVPVEMTAGKGKVTIVDTDEGPRRDTSLEALAKLKPAFKAGWPRDGGQRARPERRRGGGRRDEPRQGRSTGQAAARAHRRLCAGGRRAQVAVHRAGARRPQAAGQDRLDAWTMSI